MATGNLTLLDIASRSGSDQVVGLIEEVTTYAPEFGIVPAYPKRGTSYKITVRNALPTAAFRDVNSASTIAKSSYKQVVKEMYFLDVPLQVDEAIVKGDDGSIGDLLAQEAGGALQAATNYIGAQFFYGSTAGYGSANDAKGFLGLQSQSVGKVNTGGTSTSTSAFLVWHGPQGVSFVVGNDGEIAMPPWTKQAVFPSSTTQRMAWVSNLSSYIGLQVLSASSVWRVAGITAAAPLTDKRAAQLLAQVPMSRRQGLRWYMNRTANFTLASSRATAGYIAATSAGSPTTALPGTIGVFNQMPDMLCGIPITVTDSLVDTETNAGTTTADTYVAE